MLIPTRVLIVHAREGEEYAGWVKSLARRLRADGVDVEVGDLSDLVSPREDAEDVGRLVVLCSPGLKRAVDAGPTLRRFLELLRRMTVPVLVAGEPGAAIPEVLAGEDAIDLSRRESFEEEYAALVDRLDADRLDAAGRGVSLDAPPEPDPGLATEPPSRVEPPPPRGVDQDVDLPRPASVREWEEEVEFDLDDEDGGLVISSRAEEGARRRFLDRLFDRAKEGSKPPGGTRAGGPHGSGSRAEDGSPPESETPATDSVEVTTVTPTAVAPGDRFLVRVVLHLPGHDVEAGEDEEVDAGVATLPLRSGARVTVRLVSVDEEAFRIDDPEAPLVWGPPSRRAEFRLRSAPDLAPGVYDLRAEYWCEGVQLARNYLEISVGRGDRAGSSERVTPQRPLPRSAFASYSRRDRADVAQRVDALLAVGIDVFLDCLDIQQGADWEEVLDRELLSRDALLLFWSTAARESEWVEKEWRFALDHRGLDTILPNALEPPATCPPPEELASLQFGSVLTELAEAWRRQAAERG